MATVRVWAPEVETVVAVTDGGTVPMTRGEGGWWQATDSRLDAGYLLTLDGQDPVPDPRAAWQPEGINRPSRPVDHASFAWTDGGWRGVHLPSSVVYELHVGTFSESGDFDGVIAHLDDLVELGVDAIELMPVAEFSGRRGWGYDGVHLFAPHHAYGGPDGLKRLVDACHGRGLGVLLDVVYNHLGPSGNYLPRFGPYFTDRYRTPWGDAMNYDGPGSDEVRRFVIDNACMWLRDYHLDGLRLDAVHAIVDTSATNLLEELAVEVEQLAAHVGRPLWLVAESDANDPRLVTSRTAGGYGLHAQWSDDIHHTLHVTLTGESRGYYADYGGFAMLARALTGGYALTGQYAHHRGRRHGRAPVGVPLWRFVGCLQNHDQVGNRALGERITHLVEHDRVRAAVALLLCAPCVPMLFQGEEWAASSPFLYFTDHEDPELAAAVREGRRGEFAAFHEPGEIPDPQAAETFERSRLHWNERGRSPHQEMLAWYRALLSLRRAHPDLAAGAPAQTRYDEDAGWFVLERGAVSVCANFGGAPTTVPFDRPVRDALARSDGAQLTEGSVRLGPGAVAVVAH